MSNDWSDTPPTEDGYYWLREKSRGIEAPVQKEGDWWDVGNTEFTTIYFQFGSRIPSNEELLAMRQQIAELTAQRDAAEAELEAATQRLIDQEVA